MAADSNPFPVWNASNPSESIVNLYNWTIKETQGRINWYIRNSVVKKFGSQWIRIFVIVFAAVGALCPFVDATGIFIKTPLAQIGKWGYVFFALAAAIFLFDKYFGLSTGWMRFVVTQLTLERMLKEFQYNWVNLNIQGVPVQTMSDQLKNFCVQVEIQVKQETDAWVIEFQNDINALQSMLKTASESKVIGDSDISAETTGDQAAATKTTN